jgi:hypothetical protein
MADGDPLLAGRITTSTNSTMLDHNAAASGETGLVVLGGGIGILAGPHQTNGWGIMGSSTGSVGVYGQGGGRGVYGLVPDESRSPYSTAGVQGEGGAVAGVHGYNSRASAAGVRGDSPAGTGVAGTSTRRSGVFGRSIDGAGVYGHCDNGVGVVGGTWARNGNYAGAFWGNVWVTGSLIVGGFPKFAAVPFPDGSHRGVYSMESPECWFEDFGSARLVRGRASVRLNRDFAVLVETARYHVFLTPEGDSNGLYVSRKGRRGFEVREQQGGRGSYRIVAKRGDIATRRLPKLTPPAAPEPDELPKVSPLPRRPPSPLLGGRRATRRARRR